VNSEDTFFDLSHMNWVLVNFRFSPCIFKVNHFYWLTIQLSALVGQ